MKAQCPPTRVTFKGQVTIPKQVRDFLKIKPGDFVFFSLDKDIAVVKKAKLSPEKEFNSLLSMIDERVKKLGINDKDIEDAIKWARKM